MFIELAQFIKDAGLSRFTIAMTPQGNGRFEVIINPSKGFGEVKNEKLRQALATPLRLEGSLTDLESQFNTHLATYCESYSEVAMVANTEQMAKVAASSNAKNDKNVTNAADTPITETAPTDITNREAGSTDSDIQNPSNWEA